MYPEPDSLFQGVDVIGFIDTKVGENILGVWNGNNEKNFVFGKQLKTYILIGGLNCFREVDPKTKVEFRTNNLRIFVYLYIYIYVYTMELYLLYPFL